MKENSIEEDIKIVEQIKDIFLHLKFHGWINDIKRDIDTDKAIKAIDRILSDYKRVLKENEELKNFRRNFVDVTDKKLKEANDYFSRKYTFMGDELAQHINTLLKVTSNSIPVQKVKDKIEHYRELQNNYINKYDELNEGLQAMINALQELLEGRE